MHKWVDDNQEILREIKEKKLLKIWILQKKIVYLQMKTRLI